MRGSVFGGMVLAAWMGVAAGVRAQPEASFEVAAVKYGGGGDWYQAQTPLPTFLAFVRTQTMVDVASRPAVVELTSDKLFNYPFLVLSGHGNVVFSDDEARRLRRYLEGGGFLYIDDDYGLDRYIRREMKKVFPELEFVELPFSHPIYRAHFTFSNGLPKIHEHDGKPPQGFGLIHNGRLVAFYTYETNLTDGWEPPEVHHDPPEKREAALQMGTNILVYALTH
ncbi:MAG: DUF4159 domain-containing protein [Bacteroidetes bacterium]|nr:MAG: DUF4159 domain-containing protein [Bacteroidota bacterium]